jgi:N-acyl-phosphatidylethanolamine-hydrolysing phospholipase D
VSELGPRLAGALLALLACAPPAEGPAVRRSSDPATLYAPHGERGSFFTPWSSWRPSFWRLVRWRISRNPYEKGGSREIPRVSNDGSSLAHVENSASITWVGHATFVVHDEGDVLLTDPHFGERALIPRRIVPPGIPIESVPPDAFAVVSHNHYDHLDAYTVERLPPSVKWYVPLGLGEWFRERGRTHVTELDWWESAQHERWTLTCLPSQHWSRRFEQGVNESLWCSWLLDSGNHRYYFAGDTGYFHGFAEFGRRFTPIDVAMLPIGAYEPRWFMREQHMNPAEAYRAFLDLGAHMMLPMHWGTFDLTDEPADLPPGVLRQAVRQAGGDASRIRLLAIGERWPVPRREKTALAMSASPP